LDFLAAAIECGELEAFRDYGAWAARVLKARDILPGFLAENLEQIGHNLQLRLPAPDAAFGEAFIRAGVEGTRLDGGAAGEAPAGKLAQLAGIYTGAAIGGSRQAAFNLILEAVREGHPVIDIYSDVLQVAMHKIGRMWEANEITVAQEHMATVITQFVVAQLYPLIDHSQAPRGRIVITGVQGEFHQVGANMVADVLEASGWDVRFLGTDTPMQGVLDAIEEHEAGILGISATMLFSIPNVARLVASVRDKFGSRFPIMLGGAAFRSAPGLFKELGANACGLDLQSAITFAAELTQRKSVLIVDDDPGVRTLLRVLLEDAGYQTIEAENGRAAIDILRERAIDLALLDLVMPEQEGLETIPMIKTGFPATKIIAMSGAFGGTFLSVAQSLGVAAVLAKPFTPGVLLETLTRVLASPSRAQGRGH
jgi:methanogenic corrinoid protein MtbC1/ActR/RegA family two-component response regulator